MAQGEDRNGEKLLFDKDLTSPSTFHSEHKLKPACMDLLASLCLEKNGVIGHWLLLL